MKKGEEENSTSVYGWIRIKDIIYYEYRQELVNALFILIGMQLGVPLLTLLQRIGSRMSTNVPCTSKCRSWVFTGLIACGSGGPQGRRRDVVIITFIIPHRTKQ